MSINGTIRTKVGNKLEEYYPKTVSDQVLVDTKSLTQKLKEMDALISESVTITDPDEGTSNIIYKIVNSVKMPTPDGYIIKPSVYDNGAIHQSAICIDTKQKFERWKVEDVWTKWTVESSGALRLHSANIRVDITEEISEFTNPIEGYDEEKHEIFGLVVNTVFFTKDRFTIEGSMIKLLDDEMLYPDDEVYVVLMQLVKNDTHIEHDLDGNIIAPGTINKTKLSGELNAMIAKHEATSKEVESFNEISKPADVTIQGRTLVNLLGRAGNPVYKYLHKFTPVVGTLDMTVVENDYFKTTIQQSSHALKFTVPFEVGSKYVVIYDGRCEVGGSLHIGQYADSQTNIFKGNTLVGEGLKTGFKPVIGTFDVKAINTLSAIYFTGTADKSRIYHTKNVRVYKLTDKEYTEINNLIAKNTVDANVEIARKYPYVDDIRGVVNPYVECNENLLGTGMVLRGYTYNLNPDESDYLWGNIVPNLNGELRAAFSHKITVTEGQYTISNPNLDITNLQIRISCTRQSDMSYMDLLPWGTLFDKDITFTVPEGYRSISVAFKKGEDIPFEDSEFRQLEKAKLVLVKGSVAKTYEECHNSRMLFETTLFDDEKITKDNSGQYVKSSEWGETEIFADNTVKVLNSSPGLKILSRIHLPENVVGEQCKLVRYDGSFVRYEEVAAPDFEKFYIHGSVGNGIVLVLPNNITGWGDKYTPTSEEIKAFFLGWRMAQMNGTPYDGTGTKYWNQLWCGLGEKENFGHADVAYVIRGTMVTDVAPITRNEFGFVPYKLIYKKKTSNVEGIKTHGSLVTKQGVDINVNSGLVIGEDFKPMFNGGNWFINGAAAEQVVTRGDFRIEHAEDVTCNSKPVMFANDITWGGGSNGKAGIRLDYHNGDNVQVDYRIYKPDSVNHFEHYITVPGNTKGILEKTVEELSNVSMQLSDQNKALDSKFENILQVSNPNLLVNGDFKINQRRLTSYVNNSTATSAMYTVDRWSVLRMGWTAGAVVSVEPDGVRVSSNVKDDNLVVFSQVIECNSELWGKEITLSVDAKNFKYIGIAFSDQIIGAGYQATSIFKSTYNKMTLVVPQNTKSIRAELFSDPRDVMSIRYVKLEVGKHATPFIPRPYTQEISLCKHYYQRDTRSGIIILDEYGAGAIQMYIPFHVGQMRLNEPSARILSDTYIHAPGLTNVPKLNTDTAWSATHEGIWTSGPRATFFGEQPIWDIAGTIGTFNATPSAGNALSGNVLIEIDAEIY